jgi:DNA-binding transcriptional LysR family regulator
MRKDVSGALDVRLMRVLLVLLTENSVSRAAALLGQTQPAISAALKRLREMTGDPLLVRSGSHLVPTERAIELRGVVARVLEDIDASFSGAARFDPATTARRFNIVAANSLGPLFLPRMIDRLRSAAPHAALDVSAAPSDGEFVPRFERGELDLAIVNDPVRPEDLRIAPLLSTEVACLVGRRHPIAERRVIDLAEYLLLDHITPTRSPLSPLGPIDSKLHALGHSRRIAVWAPEFGVIPFVLASGGLVFTTGRPFAEHLASIMPLAVVEAPPEFGPMRFHMLWHERQHRSPAHQWLREIVRSVSSDLVGLAPPVRPEWV